MMLAKALLVNFVIVLICADDNTEKSDLGSDTMIATITNATMDELKTWEAPAEFISKYRYYLSGFDEENRPIWVTELGRWNFRDIVAAGGKKFYEFNKYIDQSMYRMVNSVKIKSTDDLPVTEYISVVDMDEFQLYAYHSLATLSYFTKISSTLLKNTEAMDFGFYVNVSYLGERMLSVMRTAMGGYFSKMDVYGTNKQAWIPKVLKKLPRDQLPTQYGGTKTKFESYYDLANTIKSL